MSRVLSTYEVVTFSGQGETRERFTNYTEALGAFREVAARKPYSVSLDKTDARGRTTHMCHEGNDT